MRLNYSIIDATCFLLSGRANLIKRYKSFFFILRYYYAFFLALLLEFAFNPVRPELTYSAEVATLFKE